MSRNLKIPESITQRRRDRLWGYYESCLYLYTTNDMIIC